MVDVTSVRQTKILVFLEQRENQNQAPDLITIIEFIRSQGNYDPVDIVKDVESLRTKLKIRKVCTGLTTTYRVIHKL
jgi:hypothetical protein